MSLLSTRARGAPPALGVRPERLTGHPQLTDQHVLCPQPGAPLLPWPVPTYPETVTQVLPCPRDFSGLINQVKCNLLCFLYDPFNMTFSE